MKAHQIKMEQKQKQKEEFIDEEMKEFIDKEIVVGHRFKFVPNKANFLGNGTYGLVFKGVNDYTGSIVAVKVMDLSADDIQLRAKKVEDLMKEIEIMDILQESGHPNILKFFAVELDEQRDMSYMVLEYAEANLTEYMDTQRLDGMTVKSIVAQIARALIHVHEHNIMHRDIKPDNILVSAKGDQVLVKLADFGFARRMEDINSIVGTKYFMAPEVLNGDVDEKSDLYSLGVTIFEIVKRFTDTSCDFEDIRGMNSFVRIFGEKIPEELKKLMMKLLKNTDERLTWSQLADHPYITSDPISEGLQYQTEESSISEDELICPYCRKKYSLKRYYDDHVEGLKCRVPCDICNRTFSNKSNCARHMRQQH